MALSPVRIPNFQAGRRIVNPDGSPANDFLSALNSAFAQLQNAQNATNAALVAAGLANAAAATANAAAESVTSEQALALSFVLEGSFAGASPLEADNAGNVTVKNHTRSYYGSPPPNPDVLITGSVVATGAAVAALVWISYDDPTRADTTPAFLFTTDQPVQGGDTHVIGQIEIPAAGTSDGGYVRPPGYGGAIP